MIQAKITALLFEPSEYQVVRSYSNKHPGQINKARTKQGYTNMQRGGHGWDHYSKASKLTLIVQVEDEQYEIWISSFFRDCYTRLTRKIVQAIIDTQPKTICVEPKNKRDGTLYYTVAEKELEAWLLRVKTNLE